MLRVFTPQPRFLFIVATKCSCGIGAHKYPQRVPGPGARVPVPIGVCPARLSYTEVATGDPRSPSPLYSLAFSL